MYSRSGRSPSSKSRSFSSFRISRACSCCVGNRFGYSFRHDGSSIPNCSATKSATDVGTAAGSERNVPSIRTVPHCTPQPSRLWERRFDRAISNASVSSLKKDSSS